MGKKKRYKKKKLAVVNSTAHIRKDAMEQGFYDGRFKQKVVTDKKKKANKEAAKKPIPPANE